MGAHLAAFTVPVLLSLGLVGYAEAAYSALPPFQFSARLGAPATCRRTAVVGTPLAFYRAVAWLCCIPNLVVAELLFNRPAHPAAARPLSA